MLQTHILLFPRFSPFFPHLHPLPWVRLPNKPQASREEKHAGPGHPALMTGHRVASQLPGEGRTGAEGKLHPWGTPGRGEEGAPGLPWGMGAGQRQKLQATPAGTKTRLALEQKVKPDAGKQPWAVPLEWTPGIHGSCAPDLVSCALLLLNTELLARAL